MVPAPSRGPFYRGVAESRSLIEWYLTRGHSASASGFRYRAGFTRLPITFWSIDRAKRSLNGSGGVTLGIVFGAASVIRLRGLAGRSDKR